MTESTEELITKHWRFNIHIRWLRENNSNCFTCSKTHNVRSEQKLPYVAFDEKKMITIQNNEGYDKDSQDCPIEVSTFTFGQRKKQFKIYLKSKTQKNQPDRRVSILSVWRLCEKEKKSKLWQS